MPDDLGAIFEFDGERFKIVGAQPRLKNEIVSERLSDGMEALFPAAKARTATSSKWLVLSAP
ncbi:MAG: hypothetical protein ISS74_04190 [Planctomycetes bacterium]|nr:hypothetical protein [Planctomycetota bacterium]